MQGTFDTHSSRAQHTLTAGVWCAGCINSWCSCSMHIVRPLLDYLRSTTQHTLCQEVTVLRAVPACVLHLPAASTCLLWAWQHWCGDQPATSEWAEVVGGSYTGASTCSCRSFWLRQQQQQQLLACSWRISDLP